MTLREKLMHYTHDLDCGTNLKQEAIATIENIAQYMDEDELLHHSRPLALAYLALTEDASVPVVHGRWIERQSPHAMGGITAKCSVCAKSVQYLGNPLNYCPSCGAHMRNGENNEGRTICEL